CLVYVILSYTSICLPIYQVVHGKHHRIERTKRCATGSGRTASLPCYALSLSPAQPPGLTKQDRGRAGVYLFLFILYLFSVSIPSETFKLMTFTTIYDTYFPKIRQVYLPKCCVNPG